MRRFSSWKLSVTCPLNLRIVFFLSSYVFQIIPCVPRIVAFIKLSNARQLYSNAFWQNSSKCWQNSIAHQQMITWSMILCLSLHFCRDISIFKPAEQKKFQFDIFVYESHDSQNTQYIICLLDNESTIWKRLKGSSYMFFLNCINKQPFWDS